jgi:hypothetical protein
MLNRQFFLPFNTNFFQNLFLGLETVPFLFLGLKASLFLGLETMPFLFL